MRFAKGYAGAMRLPLMLVLLALGASGCATDLRYQTRPQDAGRQWQPAFAGVYFETTPSPLFTWFVGRAVHSGDPFFGEPLRQHPAARDTFLKAAGSGGVTRALIESFWPYTAAESIVIWQIWCDDGAAEEGVEDFKVATSRSVKEAVVRSDQEKYYISVAHADGTTDRHPVDPRALGHCNMDRDQFTIHVSLYDRENPLPVARFVAARVQGLNKALEVALAESPKAFRVASWSAWNWDAMFGAAAH